MSVTLFRYSVAICLLLGAIGCNKSSEGPLKVEQRVPSAPELPAATPTGEQPRTPPTIPFHSGDVLASKDKEVRVLPARALSK